MNVDASTMGSVGRDEGRAVLGFEQLVNRAPAEVWRLLTPSPCREGLSDPVRPASWPVQHGACGDQNIAPSAEADRPESPVLEWTCGLETVRWEVAAAGSGARLTVRSWIDSDDVDLVGAAGADLHERFARFVRLVENGAAPAPLRGTRIAELAARYAAAAAAAFADTD